MQLPTVPSFTVNDSSLTKLQQLAGCAQFLAVGSGSPMWRYYRVTTFNISASTWTQIAFGQVAIDTDGIWTSPGIATIITQGYYCCEAQVPYEGQSGIYVPQTLFQWTAGPNNVNYTAGTQQYFGGASSGTMAITGSDFVQNISDKCPVVCYPGDTIQVRAWASVAMTVNDQNNAGAASGWYSAMFSGRFVRTGS